MKLKINVNGESKLVSVYQNDDMGEKYFARIDLTFSSYDDSEVQTTVDLPITQEAYSSFRELLKNQSKELSEIQNAAGDRNPVLKVRGNLELLLNPRYRAAKIHNLRNGFPYYTNKEKLKKAGVKT